MSKSFIALGFAAFCASQSHASLTFTIDTFTADELKFTISGTFDLDVIGDQRNWLAVKNNWSNNFGINTPWLDDSIGGGPTDSANWTLVENSILIGGRVPENSEVGTSGLTWGDSIYFRNINAAPILAGTSASGSFHVMGDGLFTVVSNLQLLSGFDNTTEDWVRLETNAVPGPSMLAMLSIGALSACRRRRN